MNICISSDVNSGLPMVCWRSDYEKSSIREIHWTDIGFHFEEALLLTRFVFHFDHVPQPVIFHLVHSHVKITTPIWLKWRYNKRQSNEYETRCSYEKSIEIGAFQGKRRALKELLVIYKRPTILVTWPCNTLISPSRKVIIGSALLLLFSIVLGAHFRFSNQT